MFDENLYELYFINDGKINRFETYNDFLSLIRCFDNDGSETCEIGIKIVGFDQVLWATLDSARYLTKINGKRITNPEYDSSTHPLLSFSSLKNAIIGVAQETSISKSSEFTINNGFLKVLAFFISEAARFEIIEHACYVLFNDETIKCKWLDWRPLLDWDSLSKYGHTHVNIPENALLLPIDISVSQSNIYDSPYTNSYGHRILTQLHFDFERDYLSIRDAVDEEFSSNIIINIPKQGSPPNIAPRASFHSVINQPPKETENKDKITDVIVERLEPSSP